MKSKMKAVLMGFRLPGVEADEIESSLICLVAHGAEVRALDPRNRLRCPGRGPSIARRS